MVRDLLLAHEVKDIDAAVPSNALTVAAEVADKLGGKYIPLDEENRVGRVVLEWGGRRQLAGDRAYIPPPAMSDNLSYVTRSVCP